MREERQPPQSPLDLVVDPPMSRAKVLRTAMAGFGLVAGLVLPGRISDTGGATRSRTLPRCWSAKTSHSPNVARRWKR